ncbi:MAG TPA: translocation/assembly module TamB domain-containing protein [Bryobacteraceae bacterium]|nr:translocation/assembly module TamB domain-containing protein [Bryobacteraceae bacterium]
MRLVRNIAIALAALILALIIAAVLIVRSSWFDNYVKRTIVASVEDSIGGKAEVGSFLFDWTHFNAVMTDFILHGTEAAGVDPLLRVARVQVDFRLFTSLHHLWDITYLGIEHPQANVIVYPDGHTNIPSPRQKSTSGDPLQTVVDLAIGRFELMNGLVAFGNQKQALDVHANNLRAQLSFNILSRDYSGQISLQPIYISEGRNTPVTFTVNLPVVISRNGIDIKNANIFSAQSAISVDASLHDLKNPKLTAHASGHLALADLKNAANLTPFPNPKSLPPAIDLDADASLMDQKIQVSAMRLSLGPLQLNATAELDPQGTYSAHVNLKTLDINTALAAMGEDRLPYEGVVQGPIELSGNSNAGLRGLAAQAKLSITRGSHGVPVSGHITADYNGARDAIAIQNSTIELPHSRLNMDGSIGRQLNVKLTTTNLDDFFATLPARSRPEIALHGGEATFQGKITGAMSAPQISGTLAATHFTLAGREFDSFQADTAINSKHAGIENGTLRRKNMQAQVSGSVALNNWKAPPSAALHANASIQNGDVADLLALAGEPSGGYSGALSANATINGTLGNPQGAASVVVTNGMAQGQPFDRAEAQVNLTDRLVTVPSAFVQLGSARVNLSAEYRHPRDSFTMGQLQASIQSDSINLAQVNAVQKQQPHTGGIVQIHANVTGDLAQQFQLTSVNGNASVRGLQWQGQNYGDLTANASTAGRSVNYNLTSNFAGSNIRVNGTTQLASEYPTTASATLANLPIERLLAAAGRKDLPVKGTLTGTANFNGTISDPQGSADLTLANATIYDDAVNRVHARLNYAPRSIDIPELELTSGPSHVTLTARYDHPAGVLDSGNLQFRLDSNPIDLARIKTLAEKRPGLAGTLQADLSGSAAVTNAEPRVQVQAINGSVKTGGLALKGRNLGDLMLTASTSAGRANVTLASAIAGASIDGHGTVQLSGDYAANAQLSLKNASWSALRPILGYNADEGHSFEAVADGQLAINGPLANPQKLSGSVQITKLQVSGTSETFAKTTHPVLLENSGPIAATIDRGAVRIQSAHLTGPQTDFKASGTVPLNGQAIDVALNGNVNLAIAQQFDRDVTASGEIVLAAAVRGSASQPQLTGQIELRNASFNSASLPTGLWKANGIIDLRGDSGVIRNLTAEVGGGRVTVTGSATVNGTLRFGLQARAARVRLMVQQGMGVVASANMTLAGTTANSSLSGTVTIDQISYTSKTDLGSVLALAAPPVPTPTTSSALLENMRIDIRIRSSSALAVQSSLAQNVTITTDLRVRGTAANPGVLGRVQITQGKLLFFGSTYTVNNGTIAFYNPIRIEPVLDLSLETVAQGVDVVLHVTGPVDNMKLSYTSDPPLQFQEIVSLLATGSTPTSDPTLLANQPAIPAQSFQQMGESAIVGHALADPVASQLQRVFGVTQLRINPTFGTGSQLPETQLSLQQQISNNLTFTYVTGLNTANAQTIQVLWTFTPQWSAEALRDYNGIFSVTFIYKKQFR